MNRKRRLLQCESLERREVLTSSVGWDGPGEGSATLRYHIDDIPAHLDEQQVRDTLREALDVWADVADLTFVETDRPGRSDSIDFSFEQIDGSGRVLARAYFPDDVNRNPIAGDVEFDIAENWEIGNARGSAAFDLLYVAVHEVGHALGLGHDDHSDAVLSDSVSPRQEFTSLSPSDVDHILELYAPAPESSVPTPADNPAATPPLEIPQSPTPPPPVPDSNGANDSPSPETPGASTPTNDRPAPADDGDQGSDEDTGANDTGDDDSPAPRRRWTPFRWFRFWRPASPSSTDSGLTVRFFIVRTPWWSLWRF